MCDEASGADDPQGWFGTRNRGVEMWCQLPGFHRGPGRGWSCQKGERLGSEELAGLPPLVPHIAWAPVHTAAHRLGNAFQGVGGSCLTGPEGQRGS